MDVCSPPRAICILYRVWVQLHFNRFVGFLEKRVPVAVGITIHVVSRCGCLCLLCTLSALARARKQVEGWFRSGVGQRLHSLTV